MNEGRDEELMARVLRAAGRPELPVGLEARVMARLAEPRAAAAREGGRWAPVAAVAVVGVAAVAVVAGGVEWAGRTERQRAGTAQVFTEPRQVATGPTAAAWSAPAQETPTGVSRLATANAKGYAVRLTARREVQREGAAVRTDAPGRVATAETGSFPAPPLPLTRQERLLLRMLRGGEGAELVATLSPWAERAAELNERSERREFFRRPLPVEDAPTAGADERKRPVPAADTEKLPAEDGAVSTTQATDAKQER